MSQVFEAAKQPAGGAKTMNRSPRSTDTRRAFAVTAQRPTTAHRPALGGSPTVRARPAGARSSSRGTADATPGGRRGGGGGRPTTGEAERG